MSFFGFDPSAPADHSHQEQQAALDARLSDMLAGEEDLAVYTWGEEGYDGLGDALEEEGDGWNDDTFGGGDAVGECSP